MAYFVKNAMLYHQSFQKSTFTVQYYITLKKVMPHCLKLNMDFPAINVITEAQIIMKIKCAFTYYYIPSTLLRFLRLFRQHQKIKL